jgi:hypothetical protein
MQVDYIGVVISLDGPKNLAVVPSEKILKQQKRVWYYGGFSGFNSVAFGHLILTDKNIFFFK